MLSRLWAYLELNIATLLNYAGTGFLLLIYAAAFSYLLISEKDKAKRVIFVWTPGLILIAFFMPPVRYLFMRFIDKNDTYYRMLWMVPVAMTVAHAFTRICAGFKLIGLPVAAAMIILCGGNVYKSVAGPLVIASKAQNEYHIPQEVIETADIIMEKEQGHRVKAVMPLDFTSYIRQYDTNIYLAYGRELIMRPDAYDELYSMLCEEPVDIEKMREAAVPRQVSYYVFPKTSSFLKDPESCGLEKAGETENHVIYRDPEELEYMSGISYYYFTD